MIFLSFLFYIVVAALLPIYYLAPVRLRWVVLLAGSLGIYGCFSARGILLLGAGTLVSYCVGLLLKVLQGKPYPKACEKICLAAGIVAVLLPLVLVRQGRLTGGGELWQALGIAYYTLQMIGYMVDVYRRQVSPERNLAKYALFVSFFPQVVLGPIARYGQLQPQLMRSNLFDPAKFTRGLQKLLWGFFLKMMIADRAGVIVDTVFDNWEIYAGSYVLAAGILYSVQLYADFMACVCIARGLALLFGIELTDNFARPYFADSIREFWGRWHISLSTWLRDYVYIPLGGNRRGKLRKYVNLAITFAVSGVWHGSGYKYIAWGLMHAMYQITGDITAKWRGKLYRLIRMEETELAASVIKKALTFIWVMLAWIMFRAASLKVGVKMLASVFTVRNPWVFFDDSLFSLGLDIKEFLLLLLSILLLLAVSYRQSRMEGELGEWLLRQHLILRWGIYLIAILTIVVYGMYGYGFDAKDFIYGGF